MAIKETREFFLRNTQINTGDKKDREVSFPVKYLVKGIEKFNRFLRGNVPSEDVIKKLFESITFKLNQEDTATSSIQGLVIKSLDSESETRTLNPSNTFTKSVVPHQLPDIVLAIDGSDTIIGSPISNNGLKLTILRRTLSALTRRNFKLEVITDKSVIIDGTSKKVQLSNDNDAPGNNMCYSTNGGGTKGWNSLPVVPIIFFRKSTYLLDIMSKNNTTLSVIQTSTSVFSTVLGNNRTYKFKAQIFLDPSGDGGYKFGFVGSITGSVIAQFTYVDDVSTATGVFTSTSDRVTSLASTIGVAGTGSGVMTIEGTLSTTSTAAFGLGFALQLNGAASIIAKGSSFVIEEYDTISS